ncbi:MAG: 16S rRNA (cytosine(1402)-N(4))-methyltransferase, partial [candidate division WWE3 bacterium]|nr:16S rRNA (cytosine(1402)-N(4))-methyltransferase [candidate division WWE3 bacterium]
MDEHIPVLLNEAVDALNVKANGCYVDCTFGFGGHSLEILKRGGQVLGLDVEEAGFIEAQSSKIQVPIRDLTFRKANFVELGEVLLEIGWGSVNGVLLDLGTSSWELEKSGRGFS